MFEETLEFKEAIFLCYGQQKTIVLQQRVPKAKVWAITKAQTYVLNKVVTTCVMDQSRGHQLLSNAFNTCINLTLILETKVRHVTDVFNVLYAFDVKLTIFQNNMKVEVIRS